MRGSLHDLKDQLACCARSQIDRAGQRRRATRPRNRRARLSDARRPTGRCRSRRVSARRARRAVPTANSSSSPAPQAAPDPDASRAAERLKRPSEPSSTAAAARSRRPRRTRSPPLPKRSNAPVMTSIQGKGAVPADHPNYAGAAWAPGNAVDELIKRGGLPAGLRLEARRPGDPRVPDDLPARGDPRRHRSGRDDAERPARPSRSLADAALDGQGDRRRLPARARRGRIQRGADPEARTESEAGSYHAERRAWPDAIRARSAARRHPGHRHDADGYVATGTYPVYEPRTFMFPNGYGTLGFGLRPRSAPRSPDRKRCRLRRRRWRLPVLDGGARGRDPGTLGLPIVIFNDTTYSAVKEAQKWERVSGTTRSIWSAIRIFKLAVRVWYSGVKVTEPERLTDEIKAAFGRNLPTIIEVPTEQWV